MFNNNGIQVYGNKLILLLLKGGIDVASGTENNKEVKGGDYNIGWSLKNRIASNEIEKTQQEIIVIIDHGRTIDRFDWN